jgi:D-alanyl-D-alanine dipeptidase
MDKRSRKIYLLLLVLAAFMLMIKAPAYAQDDVMPEQFVYLKEVIPDIKIDLRYYSGKNFIGKRIDGYHADKAIMTRKAAKALKKVQDDLGHFGLSLKIFDAYRPQRAVEHFVRWAEDMNDTKMKTAFYPGVSKKHLFEKGYIAAKSSHSRGSTVDLTIVPGDVSPLADGLDMGSGFDLFSRKSWPDSMAVSPQARANRLLLQTLMKKHGFVPYSKEWWHFTYKDEPFPDTYFDFPIK